MFILHNASSPSNLDSGSQRHAVALGTNLSLSTTFEQAGEVQYHGATVQLSIIHAWLHVRTCTGVYMHSVFRVLHARTSCHGKPMPRALSVGFVHFCRLLIDACLYRCFGARCPITVRCISYGGGLHYCLHSSFRELLDMPILIAGIFISVIAFTAP